MWLTSVSDLLKPRSRRQRPGRRRRDVDRRLQLEALEDRNLMSFSSIATYAAGLSPYAITTGHFDAGNTVDLAVVNNNGNSVSILLGKGDGTFTSAGEFATGDHPLSVATGDFNGDLKQDLVTANSGDVSVLLGNGDGTFKAPQNISLGSSPRSVAVGDFNGDGKLDLGVTSFTSQLHTGGWWGYYGYYTFYYYTYNGQANVLIGDGSGSFAAPKTTPLNGAFADASWAGDLNGDNRADLVAAMNDTNTVSVLLANADGSLQAPKDFATGYAPRSIAVGDLNGDTKLDVATGNSGSVSALMGDGAGGFGTAQTTSIGGNPLSTAMGDLNSDGKLDLVTASRIFVVDSYGYYGTYGHYEGRVNVLLGYGDGTFADVGGATPTSTDPLAVTLGTFNGDTIPDVAVADNDTNDATVLINAGDWILPPKITVNDVTVTEGDSGTVDATFTVNLSFSTTHTVTVDYSTASGTATDGKDYTGVTSPQTLTFAPGDTSKQITIQVKGDLIDEYDENFYVFLSNATVGQITDGQGVGTIVDNDPPPSLKINDVSITEGKRGTKLMTFTVSLVGLSEKSISVNYATADGTAKTSDHDYQATSGTLYFGPGQTTATFSVVIYGDSKKEPNETFSVNLSGASEATILDGVGIGTILNDDGGGNHNNQH